MLLGESKTDTKKGTVDGAVPVGKPVTGETPKVKGDGPNGVKGVVKPKEDTKNSDTKGHEMSKVKAESKEVKKNSDNLFDSLYNAVINEAEDPLDQIPEVNDQIEGEESLGGDEELGGDEDFEAQEDDLIARLKANRDELDAIIMDLEGTQEGEEESMEDDSVAAPDASEEPIVAGEAVETGAKPTELKAKGEELKKGQDVKGSKIKAKGDKASTATSKEGNPRPSELGKRSVPDAKVGAKGPMGTVGDFIQ